MINWLWILLGLATLVLGAELLVRGSVWIALALGIRPLVVGLTVVAFGTSAPELVVGLTDALKGGGGDIAVGTVFGSNVANIGLILGIAVLMRPVVRGDSKLRFEAWWLILTALLTLLPFVLGGTVTRLEGIACVALLLLFTLLLVRRELRARPERQRVSTGGVGITAGERSVQKALLHILLVGLGLLGLVYGGGWLVEAAEKVAADLGMSEGMIGATVVAVGTSLPELATALVAARRGHPELALGNVVGSNIFNVLMVLGVTASAHPLGVTWEEHGLRMGVALVLSLLLGARLLFWGCIGLKMGSFFLLSYLGYLTAEVLRM